MGLYEAMTGAIPAEQKFKLYIETLLQMRGPDNQFIRFTDLRLMRRMLRDARERAYDPRQTLEHWHYVRSSELRHIIPYVNTADYVVNGATPYELPIMRALLFNHFAAWSQDYGTNPIAWTHFCALNAYTDCCKLLSLWRMIRRFLRPPMSASL